MSKPDLVILTTHFGTNYSGGSTATCEIFSRIEHQFGSIVVLGTELGEHPFSKLCFLKYKSYPHLIKLLRSIDVDRTIFYGDFFNSIFYSLLKLPFYFTYHDNWPELGAVSLTYRRKGTFYWALYRRIFKSAKHVFVVSKHKYLQVKNYTNTVSLVRNGTSVRCPKAPEQGIRKNIVMVGNIDYRKYAKSIELFEDFVDPADIKKLDFRVDIYGHQTELPLVEKLREFQFVKMCGHVKNVPFHRYCLLLHTSLMENLSIVWCESILSNTPVVSFDVGGAKEVVTANRGMLIRPYDLDQMSAAVKSLLVDPVSIDGRSIAVDFSWDRAAKSYQQRLLNVD